MENTEVIMVKLYNGDYIIGEHATNNDTDSMYVYLENPRSFVFMPSMSGSVSVGFRPICMFDSNSKTHINIRKDQIMLTVKNIDIPKEVENGYKSHISGISIASPSDIPDLNNSNIESSGDLII